jgi:tRNA dimethylallyltransferase
MFPPAIFLMGPTAAGKTELAMALSNALPVELISVDSALVYKAMDIGTAKPSADELQRYPHHLIDILDPTEPYSAGQFREDALALMADITSRGKIPLLVGGTMLYFNALQRGLADLPSADPIIRAQLDKDIEQYGLAEMHKRLAQIDPVSAARIHVNDPQRLQRALEVFEITGKTITELTQKQVDNLPYTVLKVIITPFDRAVLHQRIEVRYRNMIERGFLDEVRGLYQREDCHAQLPAIRSVGYRQAWAYLDGDYDIDTFIYKAIVATRQMAKRQLTWLRSQDDGVWFDSSTGLPIDAVKAYLTEELSRFNNNA